MSAVAAATAAHPAEAPQGPVSDEELPWYGQLVNHILTPGSSLTGTVWTMFNVVIGLMFLTWIPFAVAFPDSIHVWVFLALGLGLALSTNWFMKEVFEAKQDFESQKEADSNEGTEPSLEEKKKQ